MILLIFIDNILFAFLYSMVANHNPYKDSINCFALMFQENLTHIKPCNPSVLLNVSDPTGDAAVLVAILNEIKNKGISI